MVSLLGESKYLYGPIKRLSLREFNLTRGMLLEIEFRDGTVGDINFKDDKFESKFYSYLSPEEKLEDRLVGCDHIIEDADFPDIAAFYSKYQDHVAGIPPKQILRETSNNNL